MRKDSIITDYLLHVPYGAVPLVCLERWIQVDYPVFPVFDQPRLTYILVISGKDCLVPSYPESFVAPSAVPKAV